MGGVGVGGGLEGGGVQGGCGLLRLVLVLVVGERGADHRRGGGGVGMGRGGRGAG